MTTHIGIIAEEMSDVDVLDELISKIAKKRYSIHQFVGHGCGKIIGKCHAWSANLRAQGCKLLILLHDLDQRNIAQLREALGTALSPSAIPTHVIVIPVRELEAWLLADHEAIAKALKLKHRLNRVGMPELVNRPKEYLGDLVFRRSGKEIYYVNSVHNVQIAKAANVANLRRCLSFVPLERFIRTYL